MKIFLRLLVPLVSMFFLWSCGSISPISNKDRSSKLLVSVKDQQMLLTKNGVPIKAYPVSTSKFGLGSRSGSKRTPLGNLEIAQKIGGGAPSGAVFKSRRRTGEILKPDAPGRDPIVTRIMWLSGKDRHNSNTYKRYIYIHGTPAERNIGKPASYGCIRMKSSDVIDLYRRVGTGAGVKIFRDTITSTPEGQEFAKRNPSWAYKNKLAQRN